ncbi:MAG: hypothetical protein JJV89_00760 [Desulfosarcina sp.]|nr:hypothetical protein [Desulfobacterales bacterium]
MTNLKIIDWVVKQKKDILLGIVIFASSYLYFLKNYNKSIPVQEHFLWLLLFLSSSILIGFFILTLCRRILKKIRSALNERLLKNRDALKLFKKIELEGNKIENSDLYQAALAGNIDICEIANELKINESLARNYAQQFKQFNWLKYDLEGNIYGLSDYGRNVMFKKKI